MPKQVLAPILAIVLIAGALLPATAQAQAGGRMQQLRQACGGDLQTFCAGVQPGGGRIIACFREHAAQLSPACRDALAAARAARAAAQ